MLSQWIGFGSTPKTAPFSKNLSQILSHKITCYQWQESWVIKHAKHLNQSKSGSVTTYCNHNHWNHHCACYYFTRHPPWVRVINRHYIIIIYNNTIIQFIVTKILFGSCENMTTLEHHVYSVSCITRKVCMHWNPTRVVLSTDWHKTFPDGRFCDISKAITPFVLLVCILALRLNRASTE